MFAIDKRSGDLPKRIIDLFEECFTPSVVVILGVAGTGKLIAALGSAHALSLHDPIIDVQNRYVMIIAGVAEIALAARCAWTAGASVNLFMIWWLSLSFATYRVGLLLIEPTKPCSCLGSLTAIFGISEDVADRIGFLITVYLCSGATFLLARNYLRKRFAVD